MMEKVWHHAFYNELCIDPAEHPLVLVEPVLNIKAHRERWAKIMFEAFGVPAIYMAPQPVLCMYAAERSTGVVKKVFVFELAGTILGFKLFQYVSILSLFRTRLKSKSPSFNKVCFLASFYFYFPVFLGILIHNRCLWHSQ